MLDNNSLDREPILVTASNLNLAIVKAAGILGVPSNDVSYDLIRESKKSFLGFFKRDDVEIRAWVNNTRAQGEDVGSESRNEEEKDAWVASPVAEQIQKGDSQFLSRAQEKPTLLFSKAHLASQTFDVDALKALIDELKEYTADLCGFILHTPVKVDAVLEDGRLVLNILNDEFNEIMQKNIKLAEALEHLIRKKPRHLKQELPFRIFIDIGGLRKKREQELIGIAAELSHQVAENKKPIVLNYRSAYDRKIIHMALDQNDKVFTKSIGSGSNRKLMILPIKEEHAH